MQQAIVQIHDEQNMIQIDQQAIANVFVAYYQSLLGTKEN